MYRLITVVAFASLAFAAATPVFAQGRFGAEATLLEERATDQALTQLAEATDNAKAA